MTRNIDKKKSRLIAEIKSIASEEEIDQLVRYIKLARLNNLHGNIFKGIRKSITVEQLKQEQHYTGINRKEFDQLVKEIDIQESIEELLEMLD